ncbi:MAG: CPBP family intramembrane glutamic endopeptidase [Chthoniobacterales bacterium]
MPEGLLTAITAVINALFLVGGVYVYLALVRQLRARTLPPVTEGERTFGLPEAIMALFLAAFFLWSAELSYVNAGKAEMHMTDLLATGLVSIALLLLVAAVLRLRGISVSSAAGFNRLPFWRAWMTGVILLFAAYPLIFLADLATQKLLRTEPSKQNIVEMFSGSDTLQQRVLIIVLAVAIAPVVEEFIFRFFFYGVVRRYFGRFAGLLVNASLFAVVHAHVPSALPLFVLGCCFTLAYEWSGSILVSMTMHALFNGLTLTALAFPDLIRP